MVVSLFEEAKPMRVRAALSRDGVEVFGDYVNMVILSYSSYPPKSIFLKKLIKLAIYEIAKIFKF